MRKSELFDAYLGDSLSAEQADQLKKVLATEAGSEEFMRHITETQIMCEILEKQQEIQKEKPVSAKPNKFIPFIIISNCCFK